MPLVARPFPPAMPHGDLTEVLPGLHFVTGSVMMPAPVPVRVSRNMTVVREVGPDGPELVLINTVRLSESGLRALDALGKVTHVLRIAGNHGMDDPFYKDRYGAKVSVVTGQHYTAGFGPSPDTYFTPDAEIDATAPLPIAGARLFVIHSKPTEALLRLDAHGGVVVAGDCLQNWASVDPYCNLLGGLALRAMGFIKPHAVGPAWLKNCKPPKDEMGQIPTLAFSHVLPSHGAPVIGDAVERYRPALARVQAL